MNRQLKEQCQEEFYEADVKTIREMLAQDLELSNVQIRRSDQAAPQWGALFFANVKLKNLDKVKALVEAGANLNNSELGTHWPSDNYEINRYFVQRGVDVNKPSHEGFHAFGVTGLDSFFLMMENGLDLNYAWPHIG